MLTSVSYILQFNKLYHDTSAMKRWTPLGNIIEFFESCLLWFSLQLKRKHLLVFSCQMLHYVPQLVASFVSLQLGAEHGANSGFNRAGLLNIAAGIKLEKITKHKWNNKWAIKPKQLDNLGSKIDCHSAAYERHLSTLHVWFEVKAEDHDALPLCSIPLYFITYKIE